MAFTADEFRDLLQLLEQRPALREELRRWVLTDELLALPQTVRELAEAQRRTEERIGQLAGHVDVLAQRIDDLTQRMDVLTQRMDVLTQRMDVLTQRMDQLAEIQLRMSYDVDRLKGHDLERRYRERAPAYFRRILRRIHVLSGDELNALLEDAVTQGQLSEDQTDEIIQADVIARGRRREDGAEVYLVVEVSWGVGLSDVRRAHERAALLARIVPSVIPVVAGSWITPEAEEPARAFQLWQVTNGKVTPPGNSTS